MDDAKQIVTVAHLNAFKAELIDQLKQILGTSKAKTVKQWLKSREVRKQLNLSPGKLQAMRRKGTIAFMRIGGAIYYDQEDIERMFDQNKVNAK